jgi:hypothetical protein
MDNENLKVLYNALLSPISAAGNRPLFTKEKIGATPEEFQTMLSDPDNAKIFHNALLSPIKALGDRPVFSADKIGASVEEFQNIFGIEKKNPIGNELPIGFAASQDTSTQPFSPENQAESFNFASQENADAMATANQKEAQKLAQVKSVISKYDVRNREYDSIVPSAVATKRYRSAEGDIQEIESPESYLSSSVYVSDAYNKIPSVVRGLLEKSPTQKLAFVKELAEDPKLRQKLTKYGDIYTPAELRKDLERPLNQAATERAKRLDELKAAGLQDQLNDVSATSELLKVKSDELKAIDTRLNFIKNNATSNAGYESIIGDLKAAKNKIDEFSEGAIKIQDITKQVEAEKGSFEQRYGQYFDKNTNKYNINDPNVMESFQNDSNKLNGLYEQYNSLIKSPEYEQYNKDVANYNDLIKQQEQLIEPLIKSNSEYNSVVDKRNKIIGELQSMSSKLNDFNYLNKDFQEYKSLANANSEYTQLVGDNVLSGDLLKRMPTEYAREFSKVQKEIDRINEYGVFAPNMEFTGRFFNSISDFFYKMGGGALGSYGDFNKLVGITNTNDYTWFDLTREVSRDFNATYGIQYIDRPAIDNKTGDIIWSNIPYVAASSSGSLGANILIGAATGGGSKAAIILPTYFSTIADRMEEAKGMGLKGTQAALYANGMALVEGLSELILPDYQLFKGINKIAFKEFLKTGKNLSLAEFTNFAWKQGLIDIPKEILEEYVVNAAEITGKSAILLANGELNKDTFINTLGNPKDYLVTAMTTALIPAGMKALTANSQGKNMYNSLMYEASKNLSSSQQSLSVLVGDGTLKQSEADLINKDLVRFSAINSVLPKDIIAEKAVMVAPLMERYEILKSRIEAEKNDVVKGLFSAQARELNKKIEAILLKPDTDFSTPTSVSEVQKEILGEDFENAEDVARLDELKNKLNNRKFSVKLDVKKLTKTRDALQKELDVLNEGKETNDSKRKKITTQGKIDVFNDQIAALESKSEIIYRETEDGVEKEVDGKITPISDSQFVFAQLTSPKGIKVIELGEEVSPTETEAEQPQQLTEEQQDKIAEIDAMLAEPDGLSEEEITNLKEEKNAIEISIKPITKVGEQGGIVQREGTKEGQPKAGERKGSTRETTQPKADNRNRPISSKEEQKVEKPLTKEELAQQKLDKAEAESKAKAEKKSEKLAEEKIKIQKVKDVFTQVTDLFYKSEKAKLEDKTKINRKRRDILNENPSVKYIWSNMSKIEKQLGNRFKKEGNCP